jgi:hypothetical protein
MIEINQRDLQPGYPYFIEITSNIFNLVRNKMKGIFVSNQYVDDHAGNIIVIESTFTNVTYTNPIVVPNVARVRVIFANEVQNDEHFHRFYINTAEIRRLGLELHKNLDTHIAQYTTTHSKRGSIRNLPFLGQILKEGPILNSPSSSDDDVGIGKRTRGKIKRTRGKRTRGKRTKGKRTKGKRTRGKK